LQVSTETDVVYRDGNTLGKVTVTAMATAMIQMKNNINTTIDLEM